MTASFIAVLLFTAGPATAGDGAGSGSLGVAGEPVAIVGGEPSPNCAWPSTVFLPGCTGTLIHPEIVVTAAHCGEDHSSVWFGEGGTADDVFSVDVEYCRANPDWPLFDMDTANAGDWAYCKLAEPMLDVPIVPPLVGCETTVLTPGRPVTLVGFGQIDDLTSGVKHQVDTFLNYVTDFGSASIGGNGQGACYGDSGGPAFVQLPDGTWRAFGIVSAGPGFCGTPFFFALIHSAIPFIEADSGIDVTPCHFGNGEWNPSPGCREFPLSPYDGQGKTWTNGCADVRTSEWSSTCGPAFDTAADLVAPAVAITSPPDRMRFDAKSADGTVEVVVTADAFDATSGIARLELAIEGEIVEHSLRPGPPWEWAINLPSGVWSLQAVGRDWADNEGWSEAVVIGVDEDPPPAPEPEPSTSSGSFDDSTGAGGGSTTSEVPPVGTSDGDSTGAPAMTDGDNGCGCRSTRAPTGWSTVLVLIALARRSRRRRVLALTLLAGCGGTTRQDEASTEASGSEAVSTRGMTISTTAGGTTEASNDATTDAGSSSTGSAQSSASAGPGCDPGTLDCSCLPGYLCGADLACLLDTCVPCEHGTSACPCIGGGDGRPGTCDRDLHCIGGFCAPPAPCFYIRDGKCDEPSGTGACFRGTDTFDCCPAREGVCEEASHGGRCPEGSDPLDCGSATDSGDSDSGSESSSSDGAASSSGP